MSYRLPMSRRIEAIVTDPAMGGGVHRDHLAELIGCKPRDKALVAALMFLYRQKRIDFAQQYVIAPAPPKRSAS